MASKGYRLSHEGVQVAVFPSQQINITQGENSPYSHGGTLNVDNACYSSMREIYAPVDMKCVRNYYTEGYGIVIYHSVEEVYMADGSKGHFTLVMMHDNNASRWIVGKTYQQGEHIYTEGNADPSGLTTGIHVHYELAKGHQIDRIKSTPNGRYHIVNQAHIDDIFFKNGTEVISENASGSWHGDRTFSFKEYDGGTIDPPSSNTEKITLDLGHLEVNMKQGQTYKVTSVNGNKVEMELQETFAPFPSGFNPEKGKFTTNRVVNVRSTPNTSSSIVDQLKTGESFIYEGYNVLGGYVWLTGVRNNQRMYVAWRVHNGEKYGSCVFI